MTQPAGFTRTQVILHWVVVVLIAFQYLASEGIETAWRAYRNGTFTQADFSTLALMHLASGSLVLILVIWRLILRARYGAPPPDPAEPALLQLLAKIVHLAIYALIVVLPISGLIGWIGGVGGAIRVHLIAKTILLPLIGLHVIGALVHHFIWKTDVLKRMLVPLRG